MYANVTWTHVLSHKRTHTHTPRDTPISVCLSVSVDLSVGRQSAALPLSVYTCMCACHVLLCFDFFVGMYANLCIGWMKAGLDEHGWRWWAWTDMDGEGCMHG